MRRLILNRDVLVELGTDELRDVAAAAGPTGPLQQCLSKIVGCNTADTWCEITGGC